MKITNTIPLEPKLTHKTKINNVHLKDPCLDIWALIRTEILKCTSFNWLLLSLKLYLSCFAYHNLYIVDNKTQDPQKKKEKKKKRKNKKVV